MARRFGSTTDKIVVSSAFGISALPATIAVRVKVHTFADNTNIFGQFTSTSTSRRIALETLTSGAIRAIIRRGGTTHTIDSGTLNTGQWYNAVFVLTSLSDKEFFIDASSVGTDLNTSSMPNNDVTHVGESGLLTPFNAADCTCADAMVWNVGLTDNEVQQYERGVNLVSIRPSALKMWLPIFGNATPEVDFSGEGNNGTVTGTTREDHSPAGPYVSSPIYKNPLDTIGGAPELGTARSYCPMVIG